MGSGCVKVILQMNYPSKLYLNKLCFLLKAMGKTSCPIYTSHISFAYEEFQFQENV